MSTATWIVLLWTGFAATHQLLLSAIVRPRSVALFGEGGHRLVFSTVAAAFALPNLWLALTGRGQAAQWWSFATGLPLALPLFAAMGLALVLVVFAFVHRAPTLVAIGGPPQVRGILRFTRHPLMMGFALFGLAFPLWSGLSTDVAFFGGLAAYALAGSWHQDRRYLREGVPGYRAFYDATRYFPFPLGRRSSSSPSAGPESGAWAA